MFNRLFLSFLLLSVFADAETLFYKKDGSPITPQEHDVLYKIMLETQFPMSIAYGNYYEDEIKAMNEKIQQQLPKASIEATFIPTLLYELLVLKFIEENKTTIDKETFGILQQGFPCIVLNRSLLKLLDESPSHLASLNQFPGIEKWHGKINNYIINFFEKNKIALPLNYKKALEVITTFFLPDKQSAYYLEYKERYSRIVAIEYQAHNSGQMILYRGSPYVDDFYNFQHADGKERSISFGSSVYGGTLIDKGACAFVHMASSLKLGYAVFIDKKAYFNDNLKNMFFIPPIITLLSLVGKGEYFHPRTKVVSLGKEMIHGLIIGTEEHKNLVPFYQIKAANKEEAQKIHNKILQYIKEHHLVFKDKTQARL